MLSHRWTESATWWLVKPTNQLPNNLVRYAKGYLPFTRMHTKLLGPCYKTGQVNKTMRRWSLVSSFNSRDWNHPRNNVNITATNVSETDTHANRQKDLFTENVLITHLPLNDFSSVSLSFQSTLQLSLTVLLCYRLPQKYSALDDNYHLLSLWFQRARLLYERPLTTQDDMSGLSPKHVPSSK